MVDVHSTVLDSVMFILINDMQEKHVLLPTVGVAIAPRPTKHGWHHHHRPGSECMGFQNQGHQLEAGGG